MVCYHSYAPTQAYRSLGLPTAADLYVHSLPGIPNLSTHPTHPLNLYSGLLPSYPGEGQGGGEDATGVDAKILYVKRNPDNYENLMAG
jgi:carboxypeptidase D